MRTHVKTEEKKKDYDSLNRTRKEENLHADRKLNVDQKKINRRLKIL